MTRSCSSTASRSSCRQYSQFLTVAVKADREQYQPREEGTLSITTKDVDGKPVSAEIALGLFDESVKYIQQDYAGDPRQFYYGVKRGQMVQTQSSFNQKVYLKLAEGLNKVLVDEKTARTSGCGPRTKRMPSDRS